MWSPNSWWVSCWLGLVPCSTDPLQRGAPHAVYTLLPPPPPPPAPVAPCTIARQAGTMWYHLPAVRMCVFREGCFPHNLFHVSPQDGAVALPTALDPRQAQDRYTSQHRIPIAAYLQLSLPLLVTVRLLRAASLRRSGLLMAVCVHGPSALKPE
jgi:hypothetical protein